MSRIGKKPLNIPEKVKVNINLNTVEIQGPKGSLTQKVNPLVRVEMPDNKTLTVVKASESSITDAQQGLIRSLLANMIKGVTDGFNKVLEINGVGYRSQVQGKVLKLQLGFSHPVDYAFPDGIEILVEKGNRITISGYDKRLVGKVAADIRHLLPPEPYKGKGIRYLGEHIRRKAGKAAVGVGTPGGGK